MNYFQQLELNRLEIQKKAEKLLEGRPEKSLNDLAEENCRLGWEWFKRVEERVGEQQACQEVPEVVANIADGWTPFTERLLDSNGSLGFSLGLCMESVEAHAWALNDFLSGKTVEYMEPDFPLVAKVSEEQFEAMILAETPQKALTKEKKKTKVGT